MEVGGKAAAMGGKCARVAKRQEAVGRRVPVSRWTDAPSLNGGPDATGALAPSLGAATHWQARRSRAPGMAPARARWAHRSNGPNRSTAQPGGSTCCRSWQSFRPLVARSWVLGRASEGLRKGRFGRHGQRTGTHPAGRPASHRRWWANLAPVPHRPLAQAPGHPVRRARPGIPVFAANNAKWFSRLPRCQARQPTLPPRLSHGSGHLCGASSCWPLACRASGSVAGTLSAGEWDGGFLLPRMCRQSGAWPRPPPACSRAATRKECHGCSKPGRHPQRFDQDVQGR